MNPADVFVVVPACNEQETLYQTAVSLLQMNFRVVIVDDGSAVSQHQYINTLPVFFIRHRLNLGQGAALQTGTEFALEKGADYIIHFDADGQHSSRDLPQMLRLLSETEADIVMGSRFLSNQIQNVPWFRKFILKTAIVFNYCFTGIMLSDAHNGLRVFNKKAAMQLKFTENRMSHATELLFQIKKYNWRWKEAPVSVLYNKHTLKKGQSSFNSIRIMFDLILYKFFQ
jgi:glycosyltransferase involved in cell wall biosynthesis